MQRVSSSLQAILDRVPAERDLLDLYELFPHDVTNLIPANAVKRWAQTNIYWGGQNYERLAVSRGDVSRFMGQTMNSVTVTLSNIDKKIGGWLFYNVIEGMRLVIRVVSRSVEDSSIAIFVGRCEKPKSINKKTAQIAAKQDLGSIDVELPPDEFSPRCPLEFKKPGGECLGDEPLASKSAQYQAATICTKDHDFCAFLANLNFFQGIRFNGFRGSFKVKQPRGGAGGALLSLIGLGNHKVRKQWTAQDDTARGKAKPLVLGRAQVEAVPIVHADTGQYIAFLHALSRGPVSGIANVHNVAAGFADTFQAGPFNHFGTYGNDPAQQQDGFFSSSGDRYSRLAYTEGTIKGDNPDTGDPAPNIVALIRGQVVGLPDALGDWVDEDWSDNPVALVRWIISNSRMLNHPVELIDDEVAWDTWKYCNEVISDASKGEQLYLPNAVSAIAGVDFKRYRSTGLVDTFWYRWMLGIDTVTPPEFRETIYSFIDLTSPPTSITAINYLRRRFTANSFLADKVKAIDYIYKTLLPVFRGYLITSAEGKIQIRSERPADSTLVRSTTAAGATEIPIEDVEPWKANIAAGYRVLALLSFQLPTSEVWQVLTTRYTTASNGITLATSTTGGGVTLTPSGATFSGATNTTTPGGATVTVGGSPANGNTATVTIDGIGLTYSLNANDTTATIALLLRDLINANTTLNRYVRATWNAGSPTIVTLTSKLGFIQFGAITTVYAHAVGDEVIRVTASYTPSVQDFNPKANIVESSFEWPLGDKQGSVNQFVIKHVEAVSDFDTVTINENDYDHQELVRKVNKMEIDGSAIDSYHQANIILKTARVKYRDNDWFSSWADGPRSLIQEEGDVACVTDPTGVFRNRAVRLEEVKIGQAPDYKISMVGRLYTSTLFPDIAEVKTVQFPATQTYLDVGPGQPTGLTLSEPAAGTVRGTFAFAGYVGDQTGWIEYKPSASGTWIDSGVRVKPDGSNNGQFEVSGIATGATDFRVTPYNKNNKAGTSSATVSITVHGLTAAIEYVMGDGSTITTGLQDYLSIPFSCTILEATLLGDAAGSIVIDIWRDSFANYPPTIADTIVASAKPTLSSAIKSTDATLTGWNKTITAGDVLAIVVDSTSGLGRCTLALKVGRT